MSPDGRLIATGSRDRTARLWDAETRAPVGSPLSHGDWVEDVAFSPDGERLLTGCNDGIAQLWSVTSGERIGPPYRHEVAVVDVAFDPEGTYILAGAGPGAKLWAVPSHVPVAEGDLDLWVQAQTGVSMDHNGILTQLSPSEWQALQRQLLGMAITE